MLQVMGTSFYVRGKLSKEQKYGGCGSDSTIFVSENMILLFWQVEKTILLKKPIPEYPIPTLLITDPILGSALFLKYLQVQW